MDKEAQEKIAHLLGMEYGDPLSDDERVAQFILQELEQLGYRKLPSKPPLLSIKQIKALFEWECSIEEAFAAQEAIKAQREADIKHYEECK